jgi:osmotically-inducible protein OsmY
MPVFGMDPGIDTGPGDWRRFNVPESSREHGYERDVDWSHPRRERGWWDRTQDEIRSWMGDTDAEHRREEDYRGRGPRGYTRSDTRIHEEVSDRLMEDRYVDASEIDVSVAGGEVTLAGMVASREMKRRAENIAASVLGVKDVHNSLRVRNAAGQSR